MREEETLTWSAGGDGDDGEALAGRPCLLSSAPSSSLFLWFCERWVPCFWYLIDLLCSLWFSVSMCLLRDRRRRWYMKVWWLPLHLRFVRSLPFSLQSPFCDVSVCPPARCLCVFFFLIVPCVFLLFQFVLCLPLFSGFFSLDFAPVPPVLGPSTSLFSQFFLVFSPWFCDSFSLFSPLGSALISSFVALFFL